MQNASTGQRLALALEGGFALPQEGRIAVYAPSPAADLSALPQDRTQIISWNRPQHDALARAGWDVVPEPDGRYALSLVCAAHARDSSRAMMGEAQARTDGPILVDGLKGDGIVSLKKDASATADVLGLVNKAHGKLFWFEGGALEARMNTQTTIDEGWCTTKGAFSADAPDPGSVLLAEALPALSGHVADLGAGWGYLSARVLSASPDVKKLHLVEADRQALGCAGANTGQDPRAVMHWADALTWRPERMLDVVVMNPPFHTDRTQDPELGRRFIRAAAGMLAPKGRLFLVANSHLGYETVLEETFGAMHSLGGNRSFKLFQAERPRSRKGRG